MWSLKTSCLDLPPFTSPLTTMECNNHCVRGSYFVVYRKWRSQVAILHNTAKVKSEHL